MRDDLIESMCAAVAADGGLRPGAQVLHLSGSVPLSALDAARDAGADVLSLHPLLSFPDVSTGIERLPGSGIAVTAETEQVEAFGRTWRGTPARRPFVLPDEVKPLYHAAAVFASNYLVAVEALAERILSAAGVAGRAGATWSRWRARRSTGRSRWDRARRSPAPPSGATPARSSGTCARSPPPCQAPSPPYVALADAATATRAGRRARSTTDQQARVGEALDPWR